MNQKLEEKIGNRACGSEGGADEERMKTVPPVLLHGFTKDIAPQLVVLNQSYIQINLLNHIMGDVWRY